MVRAGLAMGVALLCACSAQEETEAPDVLVACAPFEIALPDGACIRPGVPPTGCGEGFVHDGEYGCLAVLPEEACPPGSLAVPGESACRRVMSCAADKWGALPVDAQTEHVDAAYAGLDSDGSSSRPWRTVSQAYAAAASGALIAIAEGKYHEDVVIDDEPVRLWGVCPDKVAIVGTGVEIAAIVIGTLASGTEVGGVALSGSGVGLHLWGSEAVLVDRVWIHETASRGLNVQNDLGPTSLRVVGSLVEQARELGLFVMGSQATIDQTVVRDTLPRPENLAFGRGMSLQVACDGQGCDPAARTQAQVHRSLVERNHDAGIFVMGADAEVESSVVRTTQPQAADQRFGRGMQIQDCGTQDGCSWIARAHAGVFRSSVDENHDAGILVRGSDATVEASVVRGTLSDASAGLRGRGLSIHLTCDDQGVCDLTTRSNVNVKSSLIEQNRDTGVYTASADVSIVDTVVRDTLPQDAGMWTGRGINAQIPCTSGVCEPLGRSKVVVRGSLVERNHDVGIFFGASDGTVEASVVRDSFSTSNVFGDGIAVVSNHGPGNASLTNVRIGRSDRAGVSSFGAFVSLAQTRVECAAFELEGEALNGQSFAFEDRGNNACGCPTADGPCEAVSPGFAPPGEVSDRE